MGSVEKKILQLSAFQIWPVNIVDEDGEPISRWFSLQYAHG